MAVHLGRHQTSKMQWSNGSHGTKSLLELSKKDFNNNMMIIAVRTSNLIDDTAVLGYMMICLLSSPYPTERKCVTSAYEYGIPNQPRKLQ